MNPEIEGLRKFSQGTITKGRLGKLREALTKATALLESLQPKPDDEDAEADFESAQPDLETALDELGSACDDLEAAEDKDERESAQDAIACALEDALTNFDLIMPVSVVVVRTEEEQRQLAAAAKLQELMGLPMEQFKSGMLAWLESAPTPEEREKRKETLKRALEAIPTRSPTEPTP